MLKKTELLLLFTIILIFIALRIAFLTQKNLWFDEIFSWHLTLGSFQQLINRTSLDIHPPLYYIVLKIWNALFGDSVFSMRILSALFSVLSLLFIFPLSKRVLTHNYSLIVLIIFAVNPLNIFYSQEVRMSAMNLFLNAGSVYYLLKLLDKRQGWKEYFKQKDVYLYILFRTMALYTHYFSFFIFAVDIILVTIVPRLKNNAKQTESQKTLHADSNSAAPGIHYVISFAATILLYIPWLPAFFIHLSRGQSWRFGQAAHSPITELLNYVKDLNLGLYYHYTNLMLIYYIMILLLLIYTLAIVFAFVSAFGRSKETVPFKYSSFVLLLVILPIAITLILSLNQRIEYYRYLSIIVPYIIISFVYGISGLKKNYLIVPVFILLLVINIFGLTLQYKADFKNDDYRGIIYHLEERHRAGDRIYVEPHYMGWSIDYYKKQWDLKLPNPVYIRYGWGEIMDSINLQQPERFWVIFDFSSVDTSNYDNYINGLKKDFKVEEKNIYFLLPNRVELYRFKK